jgi:hypothetical protein
MREQFPWFLDPTEEELQQFWGKATASPRNYFMTLKAAIRK